MASSPEPLPVSLISLEAIRPTEEHNPNAAAALRDEIAISGFWSHPVLVEESVGALMDGHHRYAAAKALSLAAVPAIRLYYDDPRLRLESWRPERRLTPKDVRARALTGELFPFKTTRHIIEAPIPLTRAPLEMLSDAGNVGAPAPLASCYPSRPALLVPDYRRLAAAAGVRAEAAAGVAIETPEGLSPHPLVRQAMAADPAMAALLAALPCRVSLGGLGDAPFFLRQNHILRLSPSLLTNPAALGAAVRWGGEAVFMRMAAPDRPPLLGDILRHGMALLAELDPAAREVILGGLPGAVILELIAGAPESPSPTLRAWMAGRLEGGVDEGEADTPLSDLNLPVEALLVAGGDSRLAVDPATGFNRYGATPRPRPEAIHFSSSTASSVSDYGFLACDMLRRDLLSAQRARGISAAALREQAGDAVGLELLRLMGLTPDEADVILAPSGTDLELITVLFSLAATAPGKPLANLLIAPEETGRGVALAAAGRYFDALAGTGAPIEKGAEAWPGREILVRVAPIRDADGAVLPVTEVDSGVTAESRGAMTSADRLLLHLLASSKTGVRAPRESALKALAADFPGQVDVVVDACQMRQHPHEMGDWARRGWMVQISGSKFLTGPPFSGALVVPAGMRERAEAVAALLAAAPGVSRREDWGAWWRPRLPEPEGPPASFGPVLRWLPALMEAHLLRMLPDAQRLHVFRAFRETIRARIRESAWLDLQEEEPLSSLEMRDFASRSIVCFSVNAPEGGGRRPLSEAECGRIFRLLNRDVSGLLDDLSPEARHLAAQPAHIGQPVRLRPDAPGRAGTILRLVLGARFFNNVGHAGPSSIEAALDSEIADALRAIEKLELLARNWPQLAESPA